MLPRVFSVEDRARVVLVYLAILKSALLGAVGGRS
jgi:hypothetical protein